MPEISSSPLTHVSLALASTVCPCMSLRGTVAALYCDSASAPSLALFWAAKRNHYHDNSYHL